MTQKVTEVVLALSLLSSIAFAASAQQQPPPQKPPATQAVAGAPKTPAVAQTANPPARPSPAAALPPEYVLGPDDVLRVEFWRDKDMSSDVTVRPDGKITLPLINDVQAGGLTPDELRDRVVELAKRYIEDPSATVVVKEIKSRKVFITGEVNKPGAYLLNDRTTVLQLIAIAGGLTAFAKSNKIVIMRPAVHPAGQPITFAFNYKEVLARKKLAQNIELKPGDTVIVP